MSTLLKQAIVDAQALREAALKNAEAAIIEKYSTEVRETLDQLLEQDELGMEIEEESVEEATDPELDNIPLSATDNLSELEGENLEEFACEGEKDTITLDLGALQESIEELEASLSSDLAESAEDLEEETEVTDEEINLSEMEESDLDEDIDVDDLLEGWDDDSTETPVTTEAATSDDDVVIPAETAVTEEVATTEEAGETEEELDVSDEFISDVMEQLTVDMGADLSGWAGRSSDDMKHEIEKEMAHRRSSDIEEELEDLKKAQEELVFENSQLKERSEQYEGTINEIRNMLQDTNLSNARLLYTNRVLRNTSLNERQKDKIVEAISKAGSAAEARTIHDTLESTMEGKPSRSPKSLSEAISRPSSVVRASRVETTQADPFSSRMKRLAGIN
jgi:hypothetical protein